MTRRIAAFLALATVPRSRGVGNAQRCPTMRVSVAASGAPDSESSHPSISAAGRLVAFESTATNLAPDPNGATKDVFLRDLQLNQNKLVSQGLDGAGADGPSTAATLAPRDASPSSPTRPIRSPATPTARARLCARRTAARSPASASRPTAARPTAPPTSRTSLATAISSSSRPRPPTSCPATTTTTTRTSSSTNSSGTRPSACPRQPASRPRPLERTGHLSTRAPRHLRATAADLVPRDTNRMAAVFRADLAARVSV